MILYETLTPGYAKLMSFKQDETAVHGWHSTVNLAVRMREGYARPWRCVV